VNGTVYPNCADVPLRIYSLHSSHTPDTWVCVCWTGPVCLRRTWRLRQL